MKIGHGLIARQSFRLASALPASARCRGGPAKRSPARVYRRSIIMTRSARPNISLAACSRPVVANHKQKNS